MGVPHVPSVQRYVNAAACRSDGTTTARWPRWRQRTPIGCADHGPFSFDRGKKIGPLDRGRALARRQHALRAERAGSGSRSAAALAEAGLRAMLADIVTDAMAVAVVQIPKFGTTGTPRRRDRTGRRQSAATRCVRISLLRRRDAIKLTLTDLRRSVSVLGCGGSGFLDSGIS